MNFQKRKKATARTRMRPIFWLQSSQNNDILKIFDCLCKCLKISAQRWKVNLAPQRDWRTEETPFSSARPWCVPLQSSAEVKRKPLGCNNTRVTSWSQRRWLKGLATPPTRVVWKMQAHVARLTTISTVAGFRRTWRRRPRSLKSFIDSTVQLQTDMWQDTGSLFSLEVHEMLVKADKSCTVATLMQCFYAELPSGPGWPP